MTYVDPRPRDLKESFDWLVLAAELPADPLPVPAAGGSGLIVSGRSIVTGLAVVNTATVAGTVQLLDGVDAKGQNVGSWAVAASAGLPVSLPNKGVLVEVGCFIVVTGAVLAGAVYVIHLWRYPRTPPGE